MPPDENPPQNPIPEENSLPTSPQEPTEQGTENTAHSEPADMPSEAPEAPGDDFSVKSTDIPPTDSTPTEPEKGLENKAENEPVAEPQPEADQPLAEIQPPETAPEPVTAQIPVNEPFPASEPSYGEAKEEPKQETSKAEPEISETKPESPKEEKPKEEIKKEPEPEKEEKPRISYLKSQKLGELLVMARTAIQFRKRKKLEKIMALFLKKSKITNDEVEKFLHVSDATATRYLSILEKEGKIKQEGRTGRGVSYSKI